MSRMLKILNEYQFVYATLVIFILVGTVGVVKEGPIVGIGIGLATVLIFVVGLIFVVSVLFGGMLWFGDRRFGRPKNQESQPSQ